MRSGAAVRLSCSTKCQLPRREGRQSPCWGARGSAACCPRRLGPRGPFAGGRQPASPRACPSSAPARRRHPPGPAPGCSRECSRRRPRLLGCWTVPVRRRTVGKEPPSFPSPFGRKLRLRNKREISSSLVDPSYLRVRLNY